MTINISPRAPELVGEANMGAAIDRVEGPLKVAGLATYAYEFRGIGETAYGFIVGSTISKGRIVAIDTSAAEAAPGVLLVLSYKNAPPQGAEEVVPTNFLSPVKPYLVSDAIRYHGEPVAFIVADSFENARAAASLVRVDYETDEGAFDLEAHQAEAYKPANMFGRPTDSVIGDVDAAMASAEVTIDAIYSTPYQHHNAMEPHATLAVWEGEQLTLYSSQQMPKGVQASVAATLLMPAENIRVISRYVGGGFGGKGMIEADPVLAAMGAREVGRPVKVAMTRPQTFINAGHRPQTLQHIRLGARRDGTLTAVAIESIIQTARYNQFSEPVGSFLRGLYAAPNRTTTHRLVPLDLPAGISMRAPGEASGMLTFESAMDELAVALNMDPVELRVINEPAEDPETGKPFSVRLLLLECMRDGARRFGWENRPRIPASRREGNLLVGYGMAAAIRGNSVLPNQAIVRLEADGTAVVKTATTDIGTGTYTILAQITAAEFGLPVSRVRVEIGDSKLPYSVGSGGSFGAASAGSSVLEACRALRLKLAEIATADQSSPLRGANSADAAFRDGAIIMGGLQEPLAEFLARNAPDGIEAEGAIAPTPSMQNYSQHGHGAHFAEVTVDADTGEIRLRRMTSVFEAGRILNAKTARSQMIGGVIWGIGSALHEEAIVDTALGIFANGDLAGYHVPAHADVPELDVSFLDAYDDKANPLGIKGIGELGICGAGAAIANAVFNATGIRVREYPITLDKLLDKLP